MMQIEEVVMLSSIGGQGFEWPLEHEAAEQVTPYSKVLEEWCRGCSRVLYIV